MANKNMEALIKPPKDCTSEELAVFEALVLKGDEVTAIGLSQRIQNAERLVFVLDGECVAVGAVKNPEEGYKAGVFDKAGVPAEAANYNYELGWLYAAEGARGKGVGHILMNAVVDFLRGSGCYATTRENNDAMHHLLPLNSFKQIGRPYESSGGYRLVLYAKEP